MNKDSSLQSRTFDKNISQDQLIVFQSNLADCASSNPVPEPSMTWNYFGLKKRKFKGICHLLCQSVSKSQTLVFPACKMPAMHIHYRPFNSHVRSNSRPAAFHARLDRVDDTDFFGEKC